MNILQNLSQLSLRPYCHVERSGGDIPADLVFTHRDIDPTKHKIRPLTADRLRLARMLVLPDNLCAVSIARKTIQEWLEQDSSKQKPHHRVSALKQMDEYLDSHDIAPSTPGRAGSWMTSVKPIARAGCVFSTIDQALRSFQGMLGSRKIYVIGVEK